jgi:hypothetical protein
MYSDIDVMKMFHGYYSGVNSKNAKDFLMNKLIKQLPLQRDINTDGWRKRIQKTF